MFHLVSVYSAALKWHEVWSPHWHCSIFSVFYKLRDNLCFSYSMTRLNVKLEWQMTQIKSNFSRMEVNIGVTIVHPSHKLFVNLLPRLASPHFSFPATCLASEAKDENWTQKTLSNYYETIMGQSVLSHWAYIKYCSQSSSHDCDKAIQPEKLPRKFKVGFSFIFGGPRVLAPWLHWCWIFKDKNNSSCIFSLLITWEQRGRMKGQLITQIWIKGLCFPFKRSAEHYSYLRCFLLCPSGTQYMEACACWKDTCGHSLHHQSVLLMATAGREDHLVWYCHRWTLKCGFCT